MGSELEQHRSFLHDHFFPDGATVEVEWVEIPAPGADWKVLPISDEGRKILLAVRTSHGGAIDSFSISDDPADPVGHIVTSLTSSIIDVPKDIAAQTEMGLWVGGEELAPTLEELVDQVTLFQQLEQA